MATIIGVDLGAYAVKLTVSRGRLGRLEGTRYLSRRLPPDPEGEPPPLEARLAVLGALLREVDGLEAATFAVGLPAEQVSLRLMTLPFADRGQIEKTISFELEGFVPFDLDDHLLDYRVVGAGAKGVGARLLCALAPREAVAHTLSALAGVNVDPRHFVLDADALGAYADEGVQAVIDVGHSRTLVTLCKDGQVLAARGLSIGGADVTRGVAEALGLSFQQAEDLKHSRSLGPPRGAVPVAAEPVQAEWDDEEHTAPRPIPAAAGDPAGDALRAALQPLLRALRATLISLEDVTELGIDELVLAGGGARLDGLPAHLAEQLGVPARRVRMPETAEDIEDPGEAALAMALGLKGAGLTPGLELQFRKEEFTFKGDMARLASLAGFAAVALVFFSIVGTAMFALRYFQARAEIQDLEAQVSAVVLETFPDVSETQAKSPTMARAVMLEKTTDSLERVNVLGGVVGGEPPILGMVYALSEAMPSPNEATIDVSDLSVSPTNVTFTAETNSYEAAANIEAALQDEPRLSQAKKSEERQRGAGIQFKMNIPLVPTDGEEG